VPPLSAAARAASAAKLAAVTAADRARAATAEAKSSLEAYILRTRDALEAEDSPLAPVTTPAQRAAFSTALGDAEEWLYGDGESGDAASFRARSAVLRATGDAMELRASERAARPAAAAKARKFVSETRAAVEAWSDTKPHINATEKAGLLAAVDALESWLADAEARQAATAAHEAPAFTAAELGAQLKPVAAALAKLRKKAAPKPPKTISVNGTNATDAAGNGSTAGNASAADADGDADADADAAPVVPPSGDGTDYEDSAAAAEEGGASLHDELR
jgi:hypothetical protein